MIRRRLVVPFLSLLVPLPHAAASQQQQEREQELVVVEGAFDSNQWNAALARPQPRFPVEPSASVLLPWADEHTVGTARQRALGALALTAAGSTMRAGPHRYSLKVMTNGVRRLDLTTLPLGDRLLAIVAFYEGWSASNYESLRVHATREAKALRHDLGGTTPLVLPAMDLLMLHQLATHAATGSHDAALTEGLRTLAHAATCSDRPGVHRRSDAALLLVRHLRGEAVPADLLLAVCWPTNPVADPQHTWLGVVAAGLVTAAERAPLLPQLDRLLAARRPANAAADGGSWDPAGGLDRAETTAWHMMTLGRANALVPPLERASLQLADDR